MTNRLLRWSMALIFVSIFAVLSHASLLFFAGSSSGGTPGSAGGAPVLVTAPAFSAAPAVTQSTGGAWTGNNIMVSNGTWTNCSSCTYNYQWYLFTGQLSHLLSESQTNSFQVPNSDVTSTGYPDESSFGTDAVYAVVTAINSAGSATSVTPVTPITRFPQWYISGGNPLICTDVYSTTITSVTAGAMVTGTGTSLAIGQSINAAGWPLGVTITAGSGTAWTLSNTSFTQSSPITASSTLCATSKAADSSLAVGAWISFTAQTVLCLTSTCSTNSYTWENNNESTPAQGWGRPSPTQNAKPYQIPSIYSGYLFRAQQNYNVAGVGNLTSQATFPMGPVALSGGTILAPTNTIIPTITENPIVPVVARTIPYVGFSLSSVSNNTPGGWDQTAIPYNVTTQWMYCTTSAGSGVIAPCGTDPNPAAKAINSVTFTVNPTNGQTITINGSVWTFVSTITTGLQIQLGTGTSALATTLSNAATTLNASTDPNTDVITYARNSSVLNMTVDAYGSAGNAYALATNVTGATVANATFSGGLTASGASLVGTVLTGQSYVNYPVSSVDIGRQFFARVTAYNSAGNTVQDSIPTAAAMLPSYPAVVTPPNITGLPVIGNVGGGNGGSIIVSTQGTITGPVPSFAYQFFSCPSGSPTCTTQGAGAATQVSGVYNYAIDAATDLNHQIRLSLTSYNAVTGLSPVNVQSTPVTVTTYVQPPPLTAAALGTYPAGRDPTATFNCAPAPTTFTNTYYADNTPGAGSNVPPPTGGTSALPFATITYALTQMSPGDRLLLRGNAAWNSAANTPGNYGTFFLSGSNVDGFGNTSWKTIAADTATGAVPALNWTRATGSATDRGWNFDGVRFQATGGRSLGGDNFRDFIFQNGIIGSYPDLTTAINDYETNCVAPATCSSGSLAAWLQTHVEGGLQMRTNAHCEAYDNNKIWFIGAGSDIGVSPNVDVSDILIEGNDTAYSTSDFFDIDDGIGPIIFHSNKVHNGIGGPPGTSVAHPDAFQVLINGVQSNYGWEYDSNIAVRFTPDAAPLIAYVDQPYCLAHGISPGSCPAFNEGAGISCLQWNGSTSTGLRFVNNMCLNTEQMGFIANLATIANNTYVGEVTLVPPAGRFAEATGSFNYIANNAANVLDCYSTNVNTNNIILNGGSIGACGSGATSDTSGIDPFTDAYPTGGVNSTTYPLTFNGIPPSASSLFKTGLAGFTVPTVTINGTASATPHPNVGAY